jgi:hypothetical protein
MPARKRRYGHAAYEDPESQIEQIHAARERMDRASVDFLKVDLQTALTFTGIALSSSDVVRKRRNCLAARKAYDVIQRLLKTVPLSDTQTRALNRDLRRLESELKSLGEVL